MTRAARLTHEFVNIVPRQLHPAVLYVSMIYGTAVHRCPCGCGNEVVTPLSPTDWKLIYDGETISLYPSVGNWSFRCRSHYWIDRNRVAWAGDMSDDDVRTVRARDRSIKELVYGRATELQPDIPGESTLGSADQEPASVFARAGRWIFAQVLHRRRPGRAPPDDAQRPPGKAD